jgi:16S rRNA (guanine527-N7)-methyltransferase
MKGTPEQELQHLPGDVVVERIIPLSVSGLDAARCLVLLKAI